MEVAVAVVAMGAAKATALWVAAEAGGLEGPVVLMEDTGDRWPGMLLEFQVGCNSPKLQQLLHSPQAQI